MMMMFGFWFFFLDAFFCLFLENLSSIAEKLYKRLHSTVGTLAIWIVVETGMVLV